VELRHVITGEAPLHRNLIQHLVLTFFRDQLLKIIYDLVPPRHHRLGLFFVKVALGFLLKLVSVQRLELRKQLAVRAYHAVPLAVGVSFGRTFR
jgi:hypothetical protein